MSAAGSGAAKAWPGRSVLTGFLLILTIPLGLAGCAGTVRCPTPTSQLDHARQETVRRREELEKAEAEEGAWDARKEAAAERVRAIQARLDSLASERHH
jgi:hypothetical protein